MILSYKALGTGCMVYQFPCSCKMHYRGGKKKQKKRRTSKFISQEL